MPFASVTGQQANATALPFEDGSFDAVIAMHMLYHLPDPAKGFAEMHRVLKPGGFLAVTTNGAGNMRELYALTTVSAVRLLTRQVLPSDTMPPNRLCRTNSGTSP